MSENPDKYVDRVEAERSDADGQWYYHGKSSNGEILFQSEGYIRKIDATGAAGRLADELGVPLDILGE